MQAMQAMIEAFEDQSPKNDPVRERRCVIIRFPEDVLLQVFNLWRCPSRNTLCPIMDDLPDDAFVVSVHPNYEYRTIDAVIASKDFPVNPAGAKLVVINQLHEMQMMIIQTPPPASEFKK